MEINTITSILDKIPLLVETIRNFLMNGLSSVGISNSIFYMLVFVLCLAGAYYFIKQFVTSSLIFKISSIVNILILALLFYLLIIYL